MGWKPKTFQQRLPPLHWLLKGLPNWLAKNVSFLQMDIMLTERSVVFIPAHFVIPGSHSDRTYGGTHGLETPKTCPIIALFVVGNPWVLMNILHFSWTWSSAIYTSNMIPGTWSLGRWLSCWNFWFWTSMETCWRDLAPVGWWWLRQTQFTPSPVLHHFFYS